MIWLSVAIVALLGGVLILPALRERKAVLAFLDGFVVLSVTSLVALHLVPHSIASGGWLAVGATLLGLAIPLLAHAHAHPHAHDAPHDGPKKLSTPVLIIAAIGLLAHELLDGTALALPDHSHDEEHTLLALAVLLHRLPFGLALGLILMPVWGFARTFGVAVALCVATAVGFVLGGHTLPMAGMQGLAALQALIAGTLLHVIFHHSPDAEDARRNRIPAALGALLGVGVGLWLGTHDAHSEHAGHAHGNPLTDLAVRASLTLLLVLAASEGLMRLRPRLLHAMASAKKLPRLFVGALAGVLAPLDSLRGCGDCVAASTDPARADAATARIVTALGADLGALLLLAALLGPGFAAVWGLLVLLLALLAGAALDDRWLQTEPNQLPQRWTQRLALRAGDAVAHVILGLLLVAMLAPIFELAHLHDWPLWARYLGALGLGLAMPLRAPTLAVIAYALLAHELPEGALLLFLLAALSSSVAWRGVLRSLVGPKSARRVAWMMTAVALAAFPVLLGLEPNVFVLDMHWPHALELPALLGGGMLLAIALWSAGPRALLDRVLLIHEGRPHLGHRHGHAHGHAHDESCGDEHLHEHGPDCAHEHHHDAHEHGPDCAHEHHHDAHEHGPDCAHEHHHDAHEHGPGCAHEHHHDAHEHGDGGDDDKADEPR